MSDAVFVAMSGGVDSSVAALLLQRQGYSCQGVTMRLFAPKDGAGDGNLSDIAGAQAVCERLCIPHHTAQLSAQFREEVIQPFIDAYCRGATPNPCIVCNKCLKFGHLLDYARARRAQYVATGHYARVVHDAASGRYLLCKGADVHKDQSYVLYTLSQAQLAHILLPLGGLRKEEVRQIARTEGFGTADKGDSQDICFVPGGDYAAFIEAYTGTRCPPGDFVDACGAVIGRHRGIIRYTVGQRRGLGIAAPAPYYVLGKCAKSNTVTLGGNAALFAREVFAEDINLIAAARLAGAVRVRARIRYNQAEQPATVWQTGENSLRVVFDSPQRAAAEGQAVVLYDGDVVVGGGRIVAKPATS